MNHPSLPRRILSLGLTLTLLVALLAFLARAASAQQLGGVPSDSTIRLAAKQNAAVESARYRAQAAEAR